MLVKIYGASSEGAKGRYSPAECIGAQKHRIEGKPDMAHVSTSYSERANLTMRMSNRRFTRLTNAFSKKFENHAHMVAIYAVWYNWIRIHKTIRVTHAMAAGQSATAMDWADIVEAMERRVSEARSARTVQKIRSAYLMLKTSFRRNALSGDKTCAMTSISTMPPRTRRS